MALTDFCLDLIMNKTRFVESNIDLSLKKCPNISLSSGWHFKLILKIFNKILESKIVLVESSTNA